MENERRLVTHSVHDCSYCFTTTCMFRGNTVLIKKTKRQVKVPTIKSFDDFTILVSDVPCEVYQRQESKKIDNYGTRSGVNVRIIKNRKYTLHLTSNYGNQTSKIVFGVHSLEH